MRPLLRRWHRGIATSLVRWTDEVVEEGRVHRIPQAVATWFVTQSITCGGLEGDHASDCKGAKGPREDLT